MSAAVFFSIVTPSPGHERDAAHEWTAGAYSEHQWLWRFFPAPPGTPRRFLFRRRDADGLPRFYVVSDSAPEAPSPNWQVDGKPYGPRLAAGDWLRFDLRANPVVTVSDPNGRSARHDVVMHEKRRLLTARGLPRWADWADADRPALPDLIRRTCTEWLEARAARLGIEVDAATLRVEGYEQHRAKRGSLRFSTVDFTGQLRVVDPGALQQALFSGIGHGKAFGCGLLLVRPAVT